MDPRDDYADPDATPRWAPVVVKILLATALVLGMVLSGFLVPPL